LEKGGGEGFFYNYFLPTPELLRSWNRAMSSVFIEVSDTDDGHVKQSILVEICLIKGVKFSLICNFMLEQSGCVLPMRQAFLPQTTGTEELNTGSSF
jgi:hypothetical protein